MSRAPLTDRPRLSVDGDSLIDFVQSYFALVWSNRSERSLYMRRPLREMSSLFSPATLETVR